MAVEKNSPALADKPYGIVPQNVMRDTALSVQERWLYALLCTHADKNGCCRRSLEAIAGEAGVQRRAVQKWLLGLETRGLVCKLNDVGKMGVYQIIRHKIQRGAAQMKNLDTVVERKIRFSAFGKKGALVRAAKRKEPVFTETPPRVPNHTGTGVSQIIPEHDSLTGLIEQDKEDGHAALPPNRSSAPLMPHIGIASPGANSDCLQGKREARARAKLVERLGGWEVLMQIDEDGIEYLTKRQLEGTLTDADLIGAVKEGCMDGVLMA